VPPEERRLRLFDLDKRYGPCIGMTRSERWRRARELGLDPPAEVADLLRASGGGAAREACLWAGRV
jgi:DNA polymerase delta subunit 4